MAFFRRHFVAFDGLKKVRQKPVPYTYQDVIFYRRRFAALTEKKAMQEPLHYTGENVSAEYVLPTWQTDQPWLLVKCK